VKNVKSQSRLFKDHFRNKKYPNQLLERCTAQSNANEQNETPRQPIKKLVLKLPFHPGVTNIKNIWEKNLNILKQHPETAFLADHKLTVAFRRPRNIKDHLVRSDIKQKNMEPGSHPCREPKCLTCPFMLNTKEYTSHYTKSSYKIKGAFNCQSTDIIYLISCKQCGIQYVGQSGTTINRRMVGHRFDIRHEQDKPISNHFGPNNKHSTNNLKITIIDNGTQNITTRIRRETAHIRQLMTMEPYGPNLGQANI
jgi:hypothetical protein